MDIVIKRKVVSVPILPIATAVMLVLLVVTAMRVGRIQANEIGVFVNNLSGDISTNSEPGAHIYNGWISDFYVLDNSEDSYRMNSEKNDAVNIKTRDGADVTLDVAINYRLVYDTDVIRDKVIPECGVEKIRTANGEIDAYKLKWIRNFSRSIIRYKFGELEPTQFYVGDERKVKEAECKDELNQLLNPHGILVTQVVAGDYAFYEDFQNMIDDKQTADKQVDVQKSEAASALEQQKREMAAATAAKNVAIAQQEGQLQKQVLEIEAEAAKALKDAEAYAYTTKTLADAAFYKAQNDAKSILAAAQAEAAGLKALAESLSGEGGINLVKMQYAQALRGATITGVPYATDPRIQKVEISGVLPGGGN